MKGYFEINEVPKSCIGLGRDEKSCPVKSTCPVYQRMFVDDTLEYENWMRYTCERRPPDCPIETEDKFYKAIDVAAAIFRAAVGLGMLLVLFLAFRALFSDLITQKRITDICMWVIVVL